MRWVNERQCLAWAAERGVELDPQWSHAGTRWLRFRGDGGAARFWCTPEPGRALLTFAAALLRSMDPWKTCSVLKREGGFYTEYDDRGSILGIVGLQGTGHPAVELAATESGTLLIILMSQLAFGGCTDDDIWIIPDHGQQLLFTDHHGAAHLVVRQPESIAESVERITSAGFELPSRPPDRTFRWPDWMGPEPAGWRD